MPFSVGLVLVTIVAYHPGPICNFGKTLHVRSNCTARSDLRLSDTSLQHRPVTCGCIAYYALCLDFAKNC